MIVQPFRVALAGLLALGMTATVAAAEAGAAPEGKRIFLENHCNACHSVVAEKVEKDEAATAAPDKDAEDSAADVKPPDLSNIGASAKADFLDGYLLKKVKHEERKHPKRFSGSKEERLALIAWLVGLKHGAPSK